MRDVIFRTHTNIYFLEQVYIEYEGPLFFLCSDQFDSRYLVQAGASSSEYETWLLVKVSTERLRDVLTDQISLFDVFKKSENGDLLSLTTKIGSKYETEVIIKANEIDDDELPSPGYYLELDESFLRKTDVKPYDEASLSKVVNYNRLDLELVNSNKPQSHVIEVGVAGSFLTNFNDLRLSFSLLNDVATNGRLTNIIRERSRIVLADVRAASLVFVLEDEEMVLDDTHRLRQVSELLQINDMNLLDEELKSLNPSVAVRYYNFLSSAIETESELKVIYTPAFNGVPLKFAITRNDLANRRQHLKSLEVEKVEPQSMHGKLFGYEQNRKIFSFIPDGEDHVISGKIEDDVINRYNEKSIGVNDTGNIYLKKVIKSKLDNIVINYWMSDFIADQDNLPNIKQTNEQQKERYPSEL